MTGKQTFPLPPELIDLILEQFSGDKESLSSCSLVTSLWLVQSRSHLFRSVVVRSTSHTDTKFHEFVKFIDNTPDIRPLIRTLRLRGLRTSDWDRPSFAARMAPQSCGEVDASLLLSIISLLSSNIFSLHVEAVNMRRDVDQTFRRHPPVYQIKTLKFHDIPPHYIPPGDFSNLFDFIRVFSQIENLSITKANLKFPRTRSGCELSMTALSELVPHTHLNAIQVRSLSIYNSDTTAQLCRIFGNLIHKAHLETLNLQVHNIWGLEAISSIILSDFPSTVKQLTIGFVALTYKEKATWGFDLSAASSLTHLILEYHPIGKHCNCPTFVLCIKDLFALLLNFLKESRLPPSISTITINLPVYYQYNTGEFLRSFGGTRLELDWNSLELAIVNFANRDDRSNPFESLIFAFADESTITEKYTANELERIKSRREVVCVHIRQNLPMLSLSEWLTFRA